MAIQPTNTSQVESKPTTPLLFHNNLTTTIEVEPLNFPKPEENTFQFEKRKPKERREERKQEEPNEEEDYLSGCCFGLICSGLCACLLQGVF